MRKLSALASIMLGLGVLSGCSFTVSTTETPVTTGSTIVTGNTLETGNVQEAISSFDASKVEFIVDDAKMESYYMYKNIKQFKDGYLGVKIGGNDGVSASIVYIKNGAVVKELKNVFWNDYYKNHTIYEYCGGVLTSCPVAAQTSCTINTDKNEDCVHSFFGYMFDLLHGTKTNANFSQKLQSFENTL
ncbi:MAG: hypothetical protein NTX91_01940 [candidate division SR1 bacterium]|nr:hypothetical protein [candidate division SR1 bacterium]